MKLANWKIISEETLQKLRNSILNECIKNTKNQELKNDYINNLIK